MKKTIEERVKSKLLHIGRKNRVLRILVVPALFICMSFFYLYRYCADNGKRFAMISLALLLFPVYSSFSFPVFTTGEADEQKGLYVEGAENISLAQETELNIDEMELNIDEMELLADYDGLGGSEYAEISHGYVIIDKYDATEILESIGEADKADSDIKNTEEGQNTEAPVSGNEEENLQTGEADEELSFASDDWRLVLINQQHSIPDDYTFTLGTIKGNLQCDERIIDDLGDMLQAAKEDGVILQICSPYRDMNRQEYLFNRKINLYMNKGFSYMEAYRLASEYVMVPGASEHQLGLALDIVCPEYTSLDEGFADTDAAKWLKEHCCEYGFILRYPLGKEYITGVEFEPWHFRYVGVEAASVIMEQDITLEEFWEDYVD